MTGIIKLSIATAIAALAAALPAFAGHDASSDASMQSLPGDAAVLFWPHETGVSVGTSETFVDMRGDGSYFDPSLGRRVDAG